VKPVKPVRPVQTSAPTAPPESFRDLEDVSPAQAREEERRRKIAAGLVMPTQTPEQLKAAAVARAKMLRGGRRGRRAGWSRNAKPGANPAPGTYMDLEGERRFVKCACGVTLLDKPEQVAGHAKRCQGAGAAAAGAPR